MWGTLLPSGLSVPHARLKGYDGFLIAIATPAVQIFHEGIQVRMMALMLTSQSGAPYYIPTLAQLTKISKDEVFFSRLCEANKKEEFINIIREQDTELD